MVQNILGLGSIMQNEVFLVMESYDYEVPAILDCFSNLNSAMDFIEDLIKKYDRDRCDSYENKHELWGELHYKRRDHHIFIKKIEVKDSFVNEAK